MAREHAVLGAYDIALQYYERASSAVGRHLRVLVDTAERNKWAKVRRRTALVWGRALRACSRRGSRRRAAAHAPRDQMGRPGTGRGPFVRASELSLTTATPPLSPSPAHRPRR
jgi:hypothetical protein